MSVLAKKRVNMNRRKKGLKILKARIKKANSKLAPPKKSQYISKAEREKLATDPSEIQMLDEE